MIKMDATDFLKKMGLSGKAASRFVKVTCQSPTLAAVNFVNLEPSRVRENRGGGAEASNNQQLFFLTDAGEGRLRVSHAVNALRQRGAPDLRGRTGTPDAIAAYVGAYVGRTAEAVGPNLTHEAPTHI